MKTWKPIRCILATCLFAYASLASGFDDDISNRVNRDYEIEEGKELQYASGVIDWWFNWVPNDRVLLTLGASWDRRVFGTEISLTGGTWEDEDLYSVYSSLRLSL